MAILFVSYRREESRADAGRLCDHLSRRFGDDNVFMDVDDIAPGDNFVERLHSTLAECDLLLVIIGPRWLTLTDAHGNRRLGAAEDFVTLEISTALERHTRVLPVLVGGANMPAATDLPASLQALATQQAISIRHDRFRDDVNHLLESVQHLSFDTHTRNKAKRVALALAAAIFMLVGIWALWIELPQGSQHLRAQPAEMSPADVRALITRQDYYSARSNPGGAGGQHDFRSVVVGADIVVHDRKTQLMWQKGGSNRSVPFDKVAQHIRSINGKGYAGFRDWRLPTVDEATSLLTAATTNGYHLDPAFEVTAVPSMWTSDTTPDGLRWLVWVDDASLSAEKPAFSAWTRLVRSAP